MVKISLKLIAGVRYILCGKDLILLSYHGDCIKEGVEGRGDNDSSYLCLNRKSQGQVRSKSSDVLVLIGFYL